MNFKDRLYNLIHEHHLKASDLAKSLDITNATLSKYLNDEKSTPNAYILFKLAKYLNVSMEYLLTGESSDLGSNSEIDFLNKFNKLNDKDKLRIEGMIDMYLNEYNQSSSTSESTKNKVG